MSTRDDDARGGKMELPVAPGVRGGPLESSPRFALRAGVLASGCGLYDGSDVHETVLALLALDRRDVATVLLAPRIDQLHVVDHTSGDESEQERREVFVESARLSRGKVADPAEFDLRQLDMLVIPGGYGPAKNLVSGALGTGPVRELQPGVRRLIEHCISEAKPIGLISLAAHVVQRVEPDAIDEASLFSAADGAARSDDRPLVVTPGYLTGRRIGEVARGIEAMVDALVELACERRSG